MLASSKKKLEKHVQEIALHKAKTGRIFQYTTANINPARERNENSNADIRKREIIEKINKIYVQPVNPITILRLLEKIIF